MTEENFHQVVDHFLRCDSLTRFLPAGGDSWHTGKQKARFNALMEEMVALKSILSVNAGLK